MAEQIIALVVHIRDETCRALQQALKSFSIEVVDARNCREASALLKHQNTIDVVFVGTDLPDGSWTEVLGLAQELKNYIPVIVVSRTVDVELYLEVLGRGAFDFVTPPFLPSDLAHVIRSAIYKELLRTKHDLTAPPAV